MLLYEVLRIIFLIILPVNVKREEKKCPFQFLRSHDDVFKCCFWADEQSKTQRQSVYYHVWHKKSLNPHIWEATTSKLIFFTYKKISWWINRLIDKLTNCCSSSGFTIKCCRLSNLPLQNHCLWLYSALNKTL